MSGYVIVVRPSQPGYTAETYPVDAEGLLSVIALLEDDSSSMTVRVIAHSLNVRRTPAGEVIGAVPQGTLLTVQLPTEWAELRGHTYEWGHITHPLGGWVALGEGLTEGIHSNKGEERSEKSPERKRDTSDPPGGSPAGGQQEAGRRWV